MHPTFLHERVCCPPPPAAGVLGQLKLKIPWSKLQSKPVIVDIRDVVLLVKPRKAEPVCGRSPVPLLLPGVPISDAVPNIFRHSVCLV